MTEKNKISYAYNPKLPILKEGWKGNIIINKMYFNTAEVEKPPLLDVLKWKFGKNPQKKEKKNDTFKLKSVPLTDFSKLDNKIVWLGHASFLITINGKTLLTDPCFYDIPMIKRLVDIPCNINDFKDLDYVLLSHDHRDHFDKKSLQSIFKNNPNSEVLVPLGMDSLLKKSKFDSIKSQEAGWYQKYEIDDDIKIYFLPAKHWCKRGLSDFNTVLWGGFLINFKGYKIFFSGDTAYSSIFKDIHNQFGDMDLCILPIGAYAPKFMMKDAHVNPEEAFQIFKDLGGKKCIPMHYGTYDLSDEPLGEPIARLNKCFEAVKDELLELNIGEIKKIIIK